MALPPCARAPSSPQSSHRAESPRPEEPGGTTGLGTGEQQYRKEGLSGFLIAAPGNHPTEKAAEANHVIASPVTLTGVNWAGRAVLSCGTSTREAVMRALRGVIALVLALVLSASVLAADFQAGMSSRV